MLGTNPLVSVPWEGEGGLLLHPLLVGFWIQMPSTSFERPAGRSSVGGSAWPSVCAASISDFMSASSEITRRGAGEVPLAVESLPCSLGFQSWHVILAVGWFVVGSGVSSVFAAVLRGKLFF